MFLLFHFYPYLGNYSVRMWDEARNGVNAMEMLRNKNPIVTYFDGAPDVWNTKPPMFIWAIATSFTLFGVNELALRLPSAIASSLVAIGMYLFASRVLRDKIVGLLSCFILFSAFGFSDIHIGRSGDYDAMLTLWVLVASFLTFLFLQKWDRKFLYSACVFWTFAVLTKGDAGLLIIPGILIYGVLTKKYKEIKEYRHILIAIGVSMLVIASYYVGREILNPGYLSAVWIEELFGRYTINNEVATNPYLYYWNWLVSFRFQHWVYFVPFSIVSYVLVKEKMVKNWILFSYVSVVMYYCIISMVGSKNIWYDAQLYPFASLLVGILIMACIRKFPRLFWILPLLVLCFYLQRYVRTNLAYIQRPDLERSNECLKYGYVFREHTYKSKDVVGVHRKPEFCIPFTFYMEKEGIQTKGVSQVTSKDTVLTCDNEVIKELGGSFATNIQHTDIEGCVLLHLSDRLQKE